jgi:hypothetical protein
VPRGMGRSQSTWIRSRSSAGSRPACLPQLPRADEADLGGEEPRRNGQAFASLKGGFALARYLAAAGELTEVPGRSPPRAPPYWKSQVLRRQALGDQGHGGDHHDRDQREASLGDEAA